MSKFQSGYHTLQFNEEEIDMRCIVESVQMLRDEALDYNDVQSKWYFKKKSKVNI